MEQEHLINNDGFPNAPRRTLAGRYFAEMTVRIPPLVVIPESFCRGSVFTNKATTDSRVRLSGMTAHMAFIKQRCFCPVFVHFLRNHISQITAKIYPGTKRPGYFSKRVLMGRGFIARNRRRAGTFAIITASFHRLANAAVICA